MWRTWIVLECVLAAAAALVVWVVIAAAVTERIEEHRVHQRHGRHRSIRHRPAS